MLSFKFETNYEINPHNILRKSGRAALSPRTNKYKLELIYVCSGLKGNAFPKLKLEIKWSPSPQPAHKSWSQQAESRAGDTRSSRLGVPAHKICRFKMESSKKASDYFGTFQYVRNGINVKNTRAILWRRMRIYIYRNRIKGVMEWEKAARRIPTRSSRYLENILKADCNAAYLLSNYCGVVVGSQIRRTARYTTRADAPLSITKIMQF